MRVPLPDGLDDGRAARLSAVGAPDHDAERMRPTTDPLARFRRWFGEARRARIDLPEAMALATADAAGRPSVRFVLLKQTDERRKVLG